ncbi:MAG TPA: hypothetical protein VJZ76_24090 [Thermoanaerobaculia bacterium]|nr:hypothetical protein [Thermoanaerobaculia bacterium]
MPRIASLFAALFVCSGLAAAENVTPEMPASELHLAPDALTTCSVIATAPKAYAVCSKAGVSSSRMNLDVDGRPLLATRVPYAPDYNAIDAGGTQFTTETAGNALFIRRVGGSAAARIDGVTTRATLTWNGGDLLLATWKSADKLMGALVDTELHIAAGPITILAAAPSSWWWTVSAGGGFMSIGRSGVIDEVPSAAVVDPQGNVRAVALPTTFVKTQTIVSSGNDYLYVWQRDQQALMAQRYAPSGDAAGGPIVVGEAGTGGFVSLTSAIWTGSDYMLGWTNGSFGTPWLRMLGGPAQVLSGRHGYPWLSAGPAGLFLMLGWTGSQTIRRLDTNGPEYDLSYGVVSQTLGAMSMDGPETAVVWTEGNEVRFGRVSADGSHLDSAGVVLPVDRADVTPAIAFDGLNYLIVWASGARINGVFVGRNGSVVGNAFLIAEELKAPGTPFVSWSGTNFIVTWRSSVQRQGAGATVTTSGVVTPIAFGTFAEDPTTSGGPHPIVVFMTWDNNTPEVYSAIVGAFLDQGSVPFEISNDTPSNLLRQPSQARVASNGRDYLVTWVVKRGFYSEAWVARVDDRGRRKGQPFAVALADKSSYGTQAIPLFDGTDYCLAVSGDASMPLYVARVDDAAFACGCLTEKIAVPLDFKLREQPRLFAAAASKDAIAIAYERPFTGDAAYGRETRVMIRFLRTPPAPRRRAAR